MMKTKLPPVLVICVLLVFLASCNLPSHEIDTMEESGAPLEAPSLPPTSLPANATLDSCLNGVWFMERGDLDIMVATLIPMPGIRVPDGNLTIMFGTEAGSGANSYDYSGSLTIRIDMNPAENQYMEGVGVFNNQGTYTTEDGMILFSATQSTGEVFEWRAYKGGQSATAPGGGPTFTLLPAGEAPYRCNSSSLEIDTRGPSGTVTMLFGR